MHTTTYHFVTVNDRQIFYRKAGDPALPAIILLHGFPTSSDAHTALGMMAEDIEWNHHVALQGRGPRPTKRR